MRDRIYSFVTFETPILFVVGATEDVRNYTDNGNRFSLTYNRYTSLHDLNSNSFFRHLADLSGGSRSDYTDTRYLAGHGDFDRDGNLLSKR